MNLPEVVNHLRDETQRIWLDEPRDVRRLRRGELSTEAGTGGQFFSTFDAANHELRGFAEHGLPPLIACTTAGGFSLQHCVKLARLVVGRRMDFAGWIGLEEFARLATEVTEVIDEARTLDEFRTLFVAFLQYTHKLHFWTTHYFPWGVGALFPHREPAPWLERLNTLVTEGQDPPAIEKQDWRVVVARTDAAAARIWAEEPGDLHRVRTGFSAHGAGSYGQGFSTLNYIAQDMRWVTDQGLPLVIRVARDDAFSLARTCSIANLFLRRSVPFLGWLGLDDYPRLAGMTLDALGTVSEKHDVEILFVALVKYAHRFQGWAYCYFPWGAGALFRRPGVIQLEGSS